jgi:hypothetical protein
LKLGQELFNREWTPNDPRCHGGDGLGPVYNETSCLACHGLGGAGGAGPSAMNVDIISAVGSEIGDLVTNAFMGPRAGARSPIFPLNLESISAATLAGSELVMVIGERTVASIPYSTSRTGHADWVIRVHLSPETVGGRFRDGFVFSANGRTLKAREFDLRMGGLGDDRELTCDQGTIRAKSITLKPDEDALREIHPALVAAPSAVIHHYGVAPGYEAWRARLMARIPSPGARSDRGLPIVGAMILGSQRNSPPLFGLGLIDDLPDQVLVATAQAEPPRVRGRLSRMTSGRIGKFGWKAQTTDLREFVLGACANELGLEVPGHSQAISPLAPALKARALDMTWEECDAMVAYVKALPAPIQLDGPDPDSIEAGRRAFEEAGCADCHRPSLGNIQCIYSDLLLHDMGPDLLSVTFNLYYGPTEKVDIPTAASMADGTEWRTPPLWGYRNSGPYLHDGRARDLHDVVKAHKGQARESAARFFSLSQPRRSEVERFLKSLAAPPADSVETTGGSATRGSLGGRPANPAPAPRHTPSNRAEAASRAEQDRRAAPRLKIAHTLEQMGKPEGALDFYRQILRDEPDSEAARSAAERIKALGGDGSTRKQP